MTLLRALGVILVFVAYCILELLWTLWEQRRGTSLWVGIWRSALLLFFFTAAMGLLAWLRPWLAFGLAAVVALLFPLQVAAVARYRRKAFGRTGRPRED